MLLQPVVVALLSPFDRLLNIYFAAPTRFIGWSAAAGPIVPAQLPR